MAIREVFYKSPHNYDLDQESDRCSVKDFGPSLTVQSMAEDVDLNVVMKRFGVTWKMPDAVASFFGDFAEGGFDFRTANEHVLAARMAFDGLPWEIKDRFAQDPERLLRFLEDRNNLEEARKMGFLKEIPRGSGTGSNVGVAAPSPAGKPAGDGASAGAGAPAGGNQGSASAGSGGGAGAA